MVQNQVYVGIHAGAILRRHGRKVARRSDPTPRLRRLRRQPAQTVHRRTRERHPFEQKKSFLLLALELATTSSDDRVHAPNLTPTRVRAPRTLCAIPSPKSHACDGIGPQAKLDWFEGEGGRPWGASPPSALRWLFFRFRVSEFIV